MQFRTTAQTSNSQAIRFISQYSANIFNLQNDISSGIDLRKASDDPIAFRQVSSLTRQLQELDSEAIAIADAEAKLNTSVSSVQQAFEVLNSAKVLAQQGVQASSESERSALAVELESALDRLIDLAKSQNAGSFLYSGARSDKTPYEFGDPLVEGGPLVANYQGSSESSFAFIGRNIAIETFYSGEEIFSNSQREDVVVYGSTGAKNGAGTDSMVGRANLIVEHSLTTYEGTSGVAAGSSSVAGDTIVGATGTHQISITDTSGTGEFGTVRLNNGDEVNWSLTDTDLEIVAGGGAKVFLDMSGITAGFSGDVNLTSEATLSVDGGATTTLVDFSNSQTIVDSTTGEQVHIDTSEIGSVGTDYLEFPGTSNAFQVLHELIEDFKGVRNLDAAEFSESLDQSIGHLTRLADEALVAIGRQSASLASLDELGSRVGTLQLESQVQISDLQATDIPTAVLNLQNQQNLLEFTYSITASIASTSILDFLR